VHFNAEKFRKLDPQQLSDFLRGVNCPLEFIKTNIRHRSGIEAFVDACRKDDFSDYLETYRLHNQCKKFNSTIHVMHCVATPILIELSKLAKEHPDNLRALLYCSRKDITALASLSTTEILRCIDHGFIPFTLRCGDDLIAAVEHQDRKALLQSFLCRHAVQTSSFIAAI
jgi:hypothetical protein